MRWSKVRGSLLRLATQPLGFVLAVAFGVRLLWIAVCPNEPTSDQFIYHEGARTIAAGLGYITQDGEPANYWPVGYSALLAPFYFAFGPHPLSAAVCNTLLGLGTVAGLDALGRLWFDERVGRIAAWAGALYPTLVLYVTCVASENAFFAGTVWFSVAATRAARARESGEAVRWLILAGILAGLTAYVRATVALLGLLLPLLLLFGRVPWPRVVVRTAVVGLVALATLVPWSMRNHEHFGSYSPFSFNGKQNLWMGNHPGTTGGYAPLPEDVASLSPLEREKILGARAKQFIVEDPGRFLALSIRRFAATMKSDTISVVWNETGIEKRLGSQALVPLKLLTTATHFALYGAVCVGLLFVGRRAWKSREIGAGDAACLVALAVSSVPFVFIVSGNRYHLALLPFSLLFGTRVVMSEETQKARAAEPLATAEVPAS